MPPRPEARSAVVRRTDRPAFAGRFFVVLLLFGMPLAASGDLLSDDEPAANGKTPLMTAAREGDAAAVRRLIAGGADVNEANAGGATALMFATLSGDPLVTSLLVRAGARTDSKAKLGWTALALAAVKGYTDVGEVLLDAGADPGARDAYGWTALMRAADRRRADFVRLLLDRPGVDLDLRQEDGATVLHIAAAAGDPGIVRLLVARGANRTTVNRNGQTAADVAQAAGHASIAAYLEEGDEG